MEPGYFYGTEVKKKKIFFNFIFLSPLKTGDPAGMVVSSPNKPTLDRFLENKKDKNKNEKSRG